MDVKEIPEDMLNKNVESYVDAMSLLGLSITVNWYWRKLY